MPKKPTPAPVSKLAAVNVDLIADDVKATNQLATLERAASEAATSLAHDLGYEGALTQGALEDEIRFYMQRSVECLLETGKRLLILRAFTDHGNSSQIETNSEFVKRLELLGISRPTAYRFMAAAKKMGKSANLAVLAGRTKNQSAFLELITHDDDVIENLAELDDFDRMSASQLRAAARDLKGDKEAAEQRVAEKNASIEKLNRQLKKSVVAATDWPDAFKVLMDQAQFAHKNLKIVIGSLDAIREEALKAEPQGPDEEASLTRAREVLAEELMSIHRSAAEYLEALGMSFDKTLGSYASKGLYQ